jgi:hypothetical protein
MWSAGGAGIEDSLVEQNTGTNIISILGDGASNASQLQFNCSNNNHNVNIIGPDHTGSPLSYSLKLPNKIAEQPVYGSGGRILESNASGALQWITTPSGGGGGGGTVTSVSALTLGTTGTDLSSTVAGGTTDAVITLQVPDASASNRGALTSTDWTTFNSKTANNGTVTSVSSTAAGDALAVAVTNPTETPAIALSWAGSSSQYVDGAGSLTTFPTIPTVSDATITFAAGTNLTGGGSVTLNQAADETITFNASAGGFPSSLSGITLSGAASFGVLHTVVTSAAYPDIVVTLPAVVAGDSAKIIGIKWTGEQGGGNTNTVIIKTPSSGVTIDGDTNSHTTGLALGSIYNYYELVTDGADWWIK